MSRQRRAGQKRALWARNLYGPLPYRRGRFEKLNDFERARSCKRCNRTGLLLIKWRADYAASCYPCNACQMWAFEAEYEGEYWLGGTMKWRTNLQIPIYVYGER